MGCEMIKREVDFGSDNAIADQLDRDIEVGMDFASTIMVRVFFLTAVHLFRDGRFERSVYAAGKIPTVKSVCELSGKLGYSVQMTLTPANTCREQVVLNHTFPQVFDREGFLYIMRKINAFGRLHVRVGDEVEKARLLGLFCNPRFSPRWHHMTRFAWLCGYLFECRLVPLGIVEPSAEEVLSPE